MSAMRSSLRLWRRRLKWAKTVDYCGPGAALALRTDLFHRTLSAERRTVKLVFFFRLPAKKDAAIDCEDIQAKDTPVDEPKVKVKMEKAEPESLPE